MAVDDGYSTLWVYDYDTAIFTGAVQEYLHQGVRLPAYACLTLRRAPWSYTKTAAGSACRTIMVKRFTQFQKALR
ncbi:hypothetical protein [Pantoea anthophila]|uniref:hypothetical protein n=1 Tax=Pantoea anthophila TaxID=470931 RepID=UPI002899FFE7|nr:hypothetical protein [Pantoea anthophila]